MATNPELEARILASPDDRDAFAVYGDWLGEQGDPRGELVTVQIKLADDPGNTELTKREERLVADHAKTWLGELAGLGPKDFAVTWRYGFLDSVRIGPPVEDYETSDIDFPGTIGKVAELPGITFLRTLVIGAISYDDYPTSWDGCVEAIAEHGVPAGLQRLEIRRGGYWDISSTELGDLSAAIPKLARLRELYIELGGFDLGKLDLPALRRLELVTGGLRKANIESIRTGDLPHLESLLLCIGDPEGDRGCDVHPVDLGWILGAEQLAGVTELGLANASFADDIAASVVRSKILPQLRRLDLSRGTMTDQGAQQLLDHADALAHLVHLDLSRNFFSEAMVAKLRTLKGVQLEDNQGNGDDYRYVAIDE